MSDKPDHVHRVKRTVFNNQKVASENGTSNRETMKIGNIKMTN